ncbi:hypothetical protein LZ554_004413 [Drepanopeziza brunnea f. sp. 'monogermtubi']|nr:hypothetical protein LZ554_004413 [Drepanopeziza brunnea f. sp. 'monogermtubi']
MPEEYPLGTYDTWDVKDSSTRPCNQSERSLTSEFDAGLPYSVSHASTSVPDHEGLIPPRVAVRGTKRSHLASWQLEITASIISVVSLLGLIVLLSQFDGHEYRQWAWKFTLNGVVAIVSTICHTALMVPIGSAISQSAWLYYFPADSEKVKVRDLEHFETFNDASRGAFGSAKLLWQIRGRNMVAIGAILTILALAFDTFTQQVVSLADRSITTGDPALYSAGEVPRSTYENGYDHGSTLSSYIPNLNTRAAIYNGILALDIQPVAIPCSTGNCTWPIVPSLAVCGECSASSFTTSCNATFCNYTMPTGTVFSSPVVSRIQNPLFQVTTLDSGGSKYNYSSSERAYVGVFDAIGAPWGENYAENSSITATECGLWICVQAYNISSSKGVQTQKTIGNFSTLAAKDTSSQNKRQAKGVPDSSSSSSSSVTANRTFAAIPASMNPMPNESFSVYGLSLVSTSNGLGALEGTVEGGVGTKYYSTNFIGSIWNNTAGGDLDPWVKRLALSMTNNLRTNPGSPSTDTTRSFYAGTSYHNQLFFRIRWVWLALPIFLVIASLLFLIGSIVRSARSGLEVFKGSPLALLFSDIDGRIKEKIARAGPPKKSGGMMGLTGQTRVVLRSENGKWLFKQA